MVAPASAPGGGALAVIRISGPGAFRAAAAFLRPVSFCENPKERSVRLMRAEDGGELLDRPMAVFYRAPKSYTGENMAEVFCHGSPYIVSRMLKLAMDGGAREARPGEFTLRAFLNGKLDLAQAEAVNDLIISEGGSAHRAAITQLEGGISRGVRKARAGLIKLLGELEVRLDDPYGEIPALAARSFLSRAGNIAAGLKELADSFEKGRRLKHGIRVTIAGAPNSGKSSLLNRLAGRDRSIVSPCAGTTRDTVEEAAELAGLAVIFTDTAGINPGTKDAVEREGMRRSLAAMGSADIILWVRDGSLENSEADLLVERAIERRAAPGADLIKVFNKSDLRAARPRKELREGLSVSCRTGKGLTELKRLLAGEEKKMLSAESSCVVTSARHYSALTAANKELSRLADLGKGEPEGFPLELAAEHLRGALNSLAEIIGETTPEEVLAGIFRNFCVGK